MSTDADIRLRQRAAEILRIMRGIPRRRFVPDEFAGEAQADRPIPIGHGQTTSQPHLIAHMIALLELEPGDRVLEIGTGSGYQTAILAALGTVDVYSVEVIPALAAEAEARLREQGYGGVHLRVGDGYLGWPEHAPYAGIIVTAAPDHLPLPLVEQLAEGGRLVIPIGPVHATQTLWRFVKHGREVRAQEILPVAFVPFTRPGEPASS